MKGVVFVINFNDFQFDLTASYNVQLDGFSLQKILWLLDSDIKRNSDGYLSRFAVDNLMQIKNKILNNMTVKGEEKHE